MRCLTAPGWTHSPPAGVMRDLNTALTNIGFHTGDVWYRVAASDAQRQLDVQWQALYADLIAGTPSIVCMHYDESQNSSEHFRLILGYDAKRDEVIYHEPAVADGEYRRMARSRLLRLWPLKYERQTWTVIRMRLEPGTSSPRSRPWDTRTPHSLSTSWS